jgi:nucleoside phosphorylase
MRPLILCPTRFEFGHVRRDAASLGAECLVIGVGCGCETTIRRVAEDRRGPRTALLVGIAGALRSHATVGQAFLADRVIDEQGMVHLPTLGSGLSRLALTCSRDVVVGEAAREAAAARTGAAMVDMESGPFARVAVQAGWRWGVLRGVSDDAARDLPAEVMRWLRLDGGTAWGNLAFDLATKPRLWPEVTSMVRHANAAMRSVRAALPTLLAETPR